jgi:photosystem II stability/assembly factor-like uncharacterized protein
VQDPVALADIYMVDATNGWGTGQIGRAGASVLYTRDGGYTWQDVSPPEAAPSGSAASPSVAYFLDKDKAWALFSGRGFRDLDEAPLWRTQDGGNTWESLEPLLRDRPIENPRQPILAFDAQGLVGFAFVRDETGAEAALLRTGDGGNTWSEATFPEGSLLEEIRDCLISGLDMDLARGGTGWITVGQAGAGCDIAQGQSWTSFVGVLATSTGGRTWYAQALPPPPAYPGIFANEGYDCFTHSPTLFSRREGALVVECLGSRSDFYARTNFVYRTSDAGDSWEISAYPGGVLTFSDRDHAWSIGKCCGLANMSDIDVSVDGGRTWRLIASQDWVSTLGGSPAGFSFISNRLGWIALDDRRAEFSLLARTEDGGKSWEEIMPMTARAGAIAHLDPGEPLVITKINMIDALNGWGVGGSQAWRDEAVGASVDSAAQLQGDHIFRTRDGGKTWRDITPPELAPLADEPSKEAQGAFLDADRAWVVFAASSGEVPQPAIVWRTGDAGRSWRPSSALPLSQVTASFLPTAMIFESTGERGWLFASSGGNLGNEYFALYRTDDGGVFWRLLSDPDIGGDEQGCYKTGMAFAASSVGWLGVDCAFPAAPFYATVDGGLGWESRELPIGEWIPNLNAASCRTRSPHLFGQEEGAIIAECTTYEPSADGSVVATTSSLLHLTSDGGETWKASPFPGGDLYFLDNSTAWALGGDIHRSLDGGSTWTRLGEVHWIGQFSFVSDRLGWAVARSDGEIALVRTFDGGRTWGLVDVKSAP